MYSNIETPVNHRRAVMRQLIEHTAVGAAGLSKFCAACIGYR